MPRKSEIEKRVESAQNVDSEHSSKGNRPTEIRKTPSRNAKLKIEKRIEIRYTVVKRFFFFFRKPFETLIFTKHTNRFRFHSAVFPFTQIDAMNTAENIYSYVWKRNLIRTAVLYLIRLVRCPCRIHRGPRSKIANSDSAEIQRSARLPGTRFHDVYRTRIFGEKKNKKNYTVLAKFSPVRPGYACDVCVRVLMKSGTNYYNNVLISSVKTPYNTNYCLKISPWSIYTDRKYYLLSRYPRFGSR